MAGEGMMGKESYRDKVEQEAESRGENGGYCAAGRRVAMTSSLITLI